MKIVKALAVAICAAFFIAPAFAQNVGTVANHAVPVGKGIGKQGFTSIGPCTTQYSLIFAGASADPACGQIDLTAGVTGTLPVINGGTGTTTVLAALQAWGLQVPNLTHKAVPVGADKIGFYDVAGTAYKYATLTELLTSVVSGVASIDGKTGIITISNGLKTVSNDLEVDAGNVPGIATNTAASAGKVGEYIVSTVLSGAAVSLSTGVDKDITTVSLTAGDWQCGGNVFVNSAGTITLVQAWMNTTANTAPTRPNGGGFTQTGIIASSTQVGSTAGSMQLLLSGSQVVSLGTNASFSSTANAYGFIGCRRMR